MSKYDVIIGIDPDIDRDGVAILDVKKRALSVQATTFGKTLAIIQRVSTQALINHQSYIIVIEAGWMNKGNYHLCPRDSRAVIAAKGVAQGRNHQRGMDIADWCKYNSIQYQLQAPLRKCWKGKDKKITEEEIESIVGYKLRTKNKNGVSTRPNQECRDAALIAWLVADLPIRLTK